MEIKWEIMTKYVKPKCECGKFLVARRIEHQSVEKPITKDGDLSNKMIHIRTMFDDSDYEIKLYCHTCGKSYDADYDDKDRIIRGNLLE